MFHWKMLKCFTNSRYRTKIGALLIAQWYQEPTCQCRRRGFNLWAGKTPWRRKWQPTPVFLPGKSHGQGSLVGYSAWGCKESHMT